MKKKAVFSYGSTAGASVVSVVHSPSADGRRRREAHGVRVGAGDALVQLVAVHLGHCPHVHGRDENVEAVRVKQRYGLPAV